MFRRFCLLCGCVLAVSFLSTSTTRGAFIVNPIDATSSNHYNTSVITRTIDNGLGGLSSPLFTNDPVPGTWPTYVVGPYNDAHFFLSFLPVTITFDLGSVYTLGDFHLWNLNSNTTGGGHLWGLAHADISYSTTGTDIASATGFQLATSQAAFLDATHNTSYAGDSYAYLNGIQARFVRFVAVLNGGNFDPNPEFNNFAGLSAIRFEAVPEPYGLVLIGLSFVTLWFCHRLKRQADRNVLRALSFERCK